MSVYFFADRLVQQEWDSDTKTYKELPVNAGCLREVVAVAEGVALGQIFALVAQHPEIKQFVANYALCGWIDEFHAAALEPKALETGPDHEKLIKLVVSAGGEIHTFENQDEFQVSTDFYGMSSNGKRWSVSLSPMNKIAHLPVEISNEFCVTKNYREEVFKARYSLTLLEFLEAIYFDISFHGGPKDNAAFGEMLTAAVDEIKAGTAALVPWNPDEGEVIQ